MRLSKDSKRAKRLIEMLEKSEDFYLHDVYGYRIETPNNTYIIQA